MRILRFLVTSFFTVGITVVVIALFGRELLLTMGSSMVRSALSGVQSAAHNSLQYARQCRERGGNGQALVGIDQVRLRFLNSRQFVTEVVCDQFSLEPIVIKNYTLPPLVHKLPGTSGIIWGIERSGVEIEIYGRSRIIAVEDESIKIFTGGTETLGVSPQSTCEGHGFMCCQAESLSGVGDSYGDVTDCPRACYTSCVQRPLILALNTDPFLDSSTKSVNVVSGEPVNFSFVTSYTQKEKIIITLDFGDGESETFDTLTGKTSHVYTCPNGGCSYTANLSAKTTSGVESAGTSITQVKIFVQ